MQSLSKWCTQPDFRGLERWASLELRYHREDARDEISHLVAISKFLSPTELCERYKDTSRKYRHFARLVGEADALVDAVSERERRTVKSVSSCSGRIGRIG
jgi:hypothetical protein